MITLNHFAAFLLLLVATTRCIGSSYPDMVSSSGKVPKSSRQESKKDSKPFNTNLSSPRRMVGLIKQEKEQLYEAYNLLHSLAQEFKKPFDSPAVIVIGHQTSGKSALIEALMGFQFNQVGGGTKTRRPIALKMQYNPSCEIPSCFLTLPNGKEESRSLAEIQAYIEAENKRLERDPTRCFDEREINIRMEYKYCPNMIVIDTPGMLHAPKGPQLTPQQRQLAQAAKEAERLVARKISCKDYIILCVEDTTDWKHATTRNLVTQIDPDLTRTVLVTTKLDTKIPQFSEAQDLEDFLRAPLISRLFPHILGGPFFTSVPSGRVGERSAYPTNEAFVAALKRTEMNDRNQIKSIMRLDPIAAQTSLRNVGVRKLRSFLEARVEDNYKRNIAKIVPLLNQDVRAAEAKLIAIDKEINALSLERLKHRASTYNALFCKELALLIQGSIKASPEEWGENMETEQMQGGSFLDPEQINSPTWQHILELEVTDSKYNLYGGAQYHRAMREFAVAVRQMKAPDVTGDEMANAVGVGDVHDGANFMRASAVIAMHKAQSTFDPMLEALRHRAVYIMKRIYHIVVSLNRYEGVLPVDQYSRPFEEMVHRIYEKFVDYQMESCIKKCRDDLSGMTRYVTWDTDSSGAPSFFDSLPTPKKLVHVYKVHVEESTKRTQRSIENALRKKEKEESYDIIQNKNKKQANNKKGNNGGSMADKVLNEWSSAKNNKNKNDERRYDVDDDIEVVNADANNDLALTRTNWQEDAQLADHYNLLQIMEEMTAGRNTNRTETIVKTLVQHVVKQWRTQFARMVITKFNYFYLMPFIDEFPAFLRNELEKVYETGISDLFDIQDARLRLQQQKADLMAEINASKLLQKRFDTINERMRSHLSKTGASDDDDSDVDADNVFDDFESSNYNETPEEEVDEVPMSVNGAKKPTKIRSRRRSNKQKQEEVMEAQEDEEMNQEEDMLDSINLDLDNMSMNQSEDMNETTKNTVRPKNRPNSRNVARWNNRSASNTKNKKSSPKSQNTMRRSPIQKNRKAVTYGSDDEDDDLYAIKEDQTGN